ncbi:tetratricopeptide repeat protein [Hymenobacter sp. NST-14]|uniref:tetratricopeptide repeat protein n=1 Tax=Hymenobacter piscis TaxID=2839984 RepID=UPI001C010762|nr:tetratricopeptide repeat protein [Hymenobacter piscis]MBT9392896.1 tetratricopeptide repeat protein [Hymenobacter piscis]
MKMLLTGGLLLLSLGGGLTRIHDRNAAVARGAAAYARGDYAQAAAAYKEATLHLGAAEDAVWLNLAHATVQAGRPAEARSYYSRLLSSPNQPVRSVALQQLAALMADRGEYAQAITLLRQALLADPNNTAARYNYELLRDFLARRTDAPAPPPPGSADSPETAQDGPRPQQTRPKAGPDTPGQRPDNSQLQDPNSAPERRPDPHGRRDPSQPSATPGNSADAGFRPGAGEQRNVARGREPGNVRGLSDEETGPEAPGGTSRRGGTEAATLQEANLQTQRARLQQMNLSPGQARQLLEALHTAEQQYLQQLPRKATKPTDKTKPGW